MKHRTQSISPFPTNFKVFLLSLCAIGWSNTTASAQANHAKAIAASLQPAPTVWGEVRIGTASRAEPDPRVREIADKLQIPAIAARQAAMVPAPGPGVVAAQRAALQVLRANSGPDLKVHFRAANQTIAQIRGAVLSRPAGGVARAGEGAAGERTARTFLQANAALLRLDDPDQELKLEVERRDAAGERHLKFNQMFKDVPVWPAGLSVHLDGDGNVTMVDGAYAPTPGGIALAPVLSADEARHRAVAGVPGGGGSATGEPELVVYAPLDRVPRLAWKLNVSRDIAHAWLVIVDAQDGRVLNRTTLCYDANIAQSARDLNNINRNVNAWSQDGKFYLADTTKKMFNAAANPIKEPKGVITILDAREVTIKELKTAFIVESADGVNWLPDGISAHYNFSQTYDYFLERHDRNSLDGKGGNIDAIVRVKDMDNAFWNGNLKIMVFGNAKPYPLALDVVGHELAHGVTENSANLIYELQPGAMNEAFSDIFGTMVEARVTGQANWTLGEQLGKIFRDLKNPGSLQIAGLNRPYPSKMSEYVDLPNSDDADHGGVHINSSIINHAFYQLAEGLPQAVGLRDAEKIFYRCLTMHLQMQSQFIDARLGCIASAEVLFGAESTQARKTAEAFDAVEIFATPATPAPAPIPAVSGEDSTVFVTVNPFTSNLALGRREASLGDPNDGVALADGIKRARPSVSGDGSVAVLVSGNNDVCLIDTANPANQSCAGFAGLVHSAAISPDGSQIAFVLRDPVTGQADNQISTVDLKTQATRTFNLVAPVLDGSPVDNVLHADSMVFTSDSRQLIYDAVSEIRFGGGTPVQRWSIFRLDLTTESTTVLVPPIEGLDTGNPNLGRAGNRYLTFDARDDESGNDFIINLDLFTGEVAEVGFVGKGIGFPCFTGDESAVIFATEDPDALLTGFSLVKQSLTETRLTTKGQPTVWVSDAPIGVIYRRGTFVGANAEPIVTLTAPASSPALNSPASITITANASDSDGTIAKVEFYEGANKLGEKAQAPYSFTWSNVPAGNYRLIARAHDNLGGVGDSEAVNVTVAPDATASPIKLTASATGNNSIRVAVAAPAGNYTLQQSFDLRTWSDQTPVVVGGSGTASAEAPGPAAGSVATFYRLRKN